MQAGLFEQWELTAAPAKVRAAKTKAHALHRLAAGSAPGDAPHVEAGSYAATADRPGFGNASISPREISHVPVCGTGATLGALCGLVPGGAIAAKLAPDWHQHCPESKKVSRR
jgi:hypothetical protein